MSISRTIWSGGTDPGGGEAERNNLVGPLEGLFVDPAAGDLRLADRAAEAIDKGLALAEIVDDIDGRPRGASLDIGAAEYTPK